MCRHRITSYNVCYTKLLRNYVLGGNGNRLSVLEYENGSLKLKKTLSGFQYEARYIQDETDEDIWISHPNEGVFYIKLNSEMDSIIVLKHYNHENGLRNNFV